MIIGVIIIIRASMKAIDTIAERTGFSEFQVEKVIDSLKELVIEQLLVGQPVQLREFLIFDFKDLPQRQRRNPRTGEVVVVPAGRLPKIRISANFKKVFAQNQAHSQIPAEDSSMTTSVSPPPLPTTAPPPLPPIAEKTYHLPNGQQKSASEIKRTANPTDLIWHPEFGTEWRTVGDALS
jgi:nucleoid DNA-binding protein